MKRKFPSSDKDGEAIRNRYMEMETRIELPNYSRQEHVDPMKAMHDLRQQGNNYSCLTLI